MDRQPADRTAGGPQRAQPAARHPACSRPDGPLVGATLTVARCAALADGTSTRLWAVDRQRLAADGPPRQLAATGTADTVRVAGWLARQLLPATHSTGVLSVPVGAGLLVSSVCRCGQAAWLHLHRRGQPQVQLEDHRSGQLFAGLVADALRRVVGVVCAPADEPASWALGRLWLLQLGEHARQEAQVLPVERVAATDPAVAVGWAYYVQARRALLAGGPLDRSVPALLRRAARQGQLTSRAVRQAGAEVAAELDWLQLRQLTADGWLPTLVPHAEADRLDSGSFARRWLAVTAAQVTLLDQLLLAGQPAVAADVAHALRFRGWSDVSWAAMPVQR